MAINVEFTIPKPRVTELRVATFGDSTADLGSITGSDTTNQEFCTVQLASPLASVNRIPTKWALSMFYPAARVIAVGGIGGQTTSQMIARETLSSSATRRSIMDVVNLSPDVVIYRGASINDMIGFTYPVNQATKDALFDRHMQIVYSFISNGVRVIDEGCAGYSAASNQSSIRALLIELNDRVKDALVGMEDRVRFLDPIGVTCGSDGAFLTGVSADGVHLNPFGQYKLGEAEAELLTEWFGQSDDISYSGVNLLGSVSQFATTTSPFGIFPSGFSLNATACTRQNGAIINKYGYRWATVEGIPTGSDPSLQLILPFGIHPAGSPHIPIVSGGKYGIECRVMMETIDGSPLGTRADITGRLDIRNSVPERLIIDISSTNPNTSAWSDDHFIHNLVWPIWESGENSSDLTNLSVWSINFWFNQGQNVRIGFSYPRIVRLD